MFSRLILACAVLLLLASPAVACDGFGGQAFFAPQQFVYGQQFVQPFYGQTFVQSQFLGFNGGYGQAFVQPFRQRAFFGSPFVGFRQRAFFGSPFLGFNSQAIIVGGHNNFFRQRAVFPRNRLIFVH